MAIDSILLPVDRWPPPWSLKQVFGNDRPVEIEIGFGKGGFLVESSQAYPACNFLGVESAGKMAHYTAQRLAKRGIENVRILFADAHYVLARLVPEAGFSAVHVYFPDPWPKKRHRKRRLLTGEFLEKLEKALQPGGRLHFATDFQDYFEETRSLFSRFPAFKPLDPRSWVESRPERCITNYEVKYRREGRPIYYALYERAS